MAQQERSNELAVGVTVQGDGAVICRLEGSIDAYSAARLRAVIGELCGASCVVIDMGGVPFVDSAGLGALIGGVRRLRETGGLVGVCCSRQSVSRLLHTTGFSRVVPLSDDVEEALAGVMAPTAP